MLGTRLYSNIRGPFQLMRKALKYVQHYNVHDMCHKSTDSESTQRILRETKTISEFHVKPDTNHPIKLQ